ncbi:hypothetical protein ACKKBG_A26760 [Auxenochlorella protothecoides x Auxenochlorella symbiontica]
MFHPIIHLHDAGKRADHPFRYNSLPSRDRYRVQRGVHLRILSTTGDHIRTSSLHGGHRECKRFLQRAKGLSKAGSLRDTTLNTLGLAVDAINAGTLKGKGQLWRKNTGNNNIGALNKGNRNWGFNNTGTDVHCNNSKGTWMVAASHQEVAASHQEVAASHQEVAASHKGVTGTFSFPPLSSSAPSSVDPTSCIPNSNLASTAITRTCPTASVPVTLVPPSLLSTFISSSLPSTFISSSLPSTFIPSSLPSTFIPSSLLSTFISSFLPSTLASALASALVPSATVPSIPAFTHTFPASIPQRACPDHAEGNKSPDSNQQPWLRSSQGKIYADKWAGVVRSSKG